MRNDTRGERIGEQRSEVGEEGFHFGTGVSVARFGSGGNALCEDLPGLFGAGFPGEELAVHEIGGDILGVALKKLAEVRVGGNGIACVDAFEGEAIAGEGVVRILGDELFQHLAAGFLLF
jgi:hypothetical protein